MPTTRVILLVEEDAVCRGFLADNLSADGYEVIVAVDKANALSKLEDDPDLVLCDVNGETLDLVNAVIGRSRSDLANTLRLLDLPDAVLDLIGDGDLSKGHGKSLLTVSDPDKRVQLALRAVEHNWSVRDLERAIADAHRPQAATDEAQQTMLRALNSRATSNSEFPVTVRALGEGFAVRVVAADVDVVERVLALLAPQSRPPE